MMSFALPSSLLQKRLVFWHHTAELADFCVIRGADTCLSHVGELTSSQAGLSKLAGSIKLASFHTHDILACRTYSDPVHFYSWKTWTVPGKSARRGLLWHRLCFIALQFEFHFSNQKTGGWFLNSVFHWSEILLNFRIYFFLTLYRVYSEH